MNAANRTALITGASGGIGAELARCFARDGYRLILVARGRAALDSLAFELASRHGAEVRVVATDLSEPGAAANVWADAARGGWAVDVLVNNAGIGLYGPLAEQDAEAQTRMLELNVVALTALTRLALPGMLERRWGRILNVASITGYQPGGPLMAAYYASKSFVLSFSRGLAGELGGSGVSVTALCPGAMRTGFDARMETGSGATYRGTLLYRWLSGTTPEAAAQAGYRGLLKQRRAVVPGVLTRLLAWAGELPPRRIALEVNRFLLKPRGPRSES